MAKPLCIVIHGFTGNPQEVAPVADALSRVGFDVLTPLLPGHYPSRKRMDKVQSSSWISSINELLERALDENREIHIVGFSMGALIAILMGHRHSVQSLVLLSPAVYVGTPNVFMTRSKQVLRFLRENQSWSKNTLRNQLVSLRAAPLYNVLQFQKVVREAKKAVPHLRAPICLIHGLNDELVDPKSSEWIYQRCASQEKELHMLTHSGHLICHDIEADILTHLVTEFLSRHS